MRRIPAKCASGRRGAAVQPGGLGCWGLGLAIRARGWRWPTSCTRSRACPWDWWQGVGPGLAVGE